MRPPGSEGDDRPTGREGNDYLIGGAGSDLFVFHPGLGKDVIADYEPGLDRLAIKGLDVTDPAEVLDAFQKEGEDAVLDLGPDRLILVGIQVSDLSVSDIVL